VRPDKHIKKSRETIKKVMQSNLNEIAVSMVSQIMGKYKNLPDSGKAKAIKDIKPKGINAYKSDLKATISVISFNALEQARKEVPMASSVKLMESEERLLLGEYELLPASARKRIDYRNSLIVSTQIADLEKALYFTFGSKVLEDITPMALEFALLESATKYITGNSINGASSVAAAATVNESRVLFFTSPKVEPYIKAYEVMNDEPKTPICKSLKGKIYPTGDPNKFKYTAPFHFNCDTWTRPLLSLPKNAKVEVLNPPKTAQESIQFSELFTTQKSCC
jgi:hypothetical protein